MPDAQAGFNNWLVNFSTLVSATPYAYGLSPADAANIAAVTAQWTAAYLPVTSKATKTPQAVAAKDTARVMAKAIVRPYAQTIANNPGVSAANKIALRLNPRTNARTAITAPVTCPVLSVQSATNLSITVRYRDSATKVDSKAKPRGVTACQIFAAASATRITDPTLLPLKMLATKSPVVVHFDASEANMPAYFAARWGVQTDGVSPWSPIVSFTVSIGG